MIIEKEKTNSMYVKVPLEMCNYVVKNKLENPFQLYIFIKLMYPSGKLIWNKDDKLFAALSLLKHEKTIKSNFVRLQYLGWIYYDNDYSYWRIISFDNLRADNSWKRRKAFCFNLNHLNIIRATLGAIIYTQAYLNYCRKYLKRKSNVLKVRSADKSFPVSCYRKDYAQISVKFISKYFHISVNKAMRLKQMANKEGLLIVKKQYHRISFDQVHAARSSRKYRNESQDVVFKDGYYHIQLIDLIFSDLRFKRRKK